MLDLTKLKDYKEPITMLTTYDALFAKLFDPLVDMLLVGDSLNMSFAGEKDTLSATMDMMIYHTRVVSRETKSSCVVCDMPFGSYTDKHLALKNASRVYQETDAHAVKIEGGESRADIIKHLTSNSIAVVGHIGLMPQNARLEGGYKIKGRTKKEIDQLLKDAKVVQEAGAFAIVIEGVIAEVAQMITKELEIPTIGIGSGNQTDGQVLVWSDMLGLYQEFKPKFVKQYLNGAELVQNAVKEYVKEVKSRKFPSEEYTY
ncbi:MAG: 3-methyl-2-oxobutanoate hydroxymethyltransferase (EC [uncultured Campylobacterales bacterium]|uniref:3-methyl-2-oxobutanoate hydroxymethyltransferase n=1 Tax=uncultured Campylobacterales bacterium TaxID=352960 RepID=A0A6S6SJ29_9BACT|nr:MAG: 3-methyl-2-oxobutanoate hydroxymethyltransferase (EC [uncultured Campylobacterales bacterium]